MIPVKLVVGIKAITPIFLGGAEPNQRAELRLPSIKGLLRYWYRAIDVNYKEHEDKYFGSTTTGQSPCLLRIDHWREGGDQWQRERYSRPATQGGFQRGSGPQAINGIAYCGYSLTLGGNNRKAISPTITFQLEVQPRPETDTSELRRAWLTALWLLVHIGGLGSRCRRGLGSLRIEKWSGWPECEDMPLACNAASPDDWQRRMGYACQKLKGWFPDSWRSPATSELDHTIMPGARLLLLTKPCPKWEDALDEAGRRLREGRREARAAKDTFGFSAGDDRMASPLFIRVWHLGAAFHAGFCHLQAPLPQKLAGNAAARDAVRNFLDKSKSGALEVDFQ